MTEHAADDYLLYIGTYTRGRREGIYVYRMDGASGALERVADPAIIDNPSFVTIDPQRRHLYAVSESSEVADTPGGVVSAFSIDPAKGALAYLGQRSTGGEGPCHLVVDATGNFLLVANYVSGSVCVLPIQDGGALGPATDFVQHQGSSVDPERQTGPHAHSVTLDAANRLVFAADLGIDQVLVYRFDADRGRLTPNDEPWIRVKAGAGPRHFDFHPNGAFAYVINELDSTITGFAYDSADGTLAEVQTVSTLPGGFAGTSTCADIHVSPSGRFLYGSNRGHDSIVVFAIDAETGRLDYAGHEPTQGRTPRNFAIDPTGTFLLAANQDSDTVVTFRIDEGTGLLEPTGHVTEVPMPVCLKLVSL